MENVLNRFSVFDFFIVLASGATFLLGLEMLGIHILGYFYTVISHFVTENGYTENIVLTFFIIAVLFVCYMIGSIFQEASSYLSKLLKIKEKAVNNLLTDQKIINNEIRQTALKNQASEVFKLKKLPFDKENITPEQNYYFYAYCVYYIQIRGLDNKTEKMRSLIGISNMLSLCFFVLSLFGMYALFDMYKNDHILTMPLIVTEITYVVLAIVFWCRMKKDVKYRIRMIAGIYEVAEERENDNRDTMENVDVIIENNKDFANKLI